MKITLAKNISLCDGVNRAYEMVKQLSEKEKGSRLFILGSLAHNDSIAAKVKSFGVKKIKTLRSVKPGSTVIITAHGIGKQTIDSIIRKKAQVFDATCPKVIKVQRLAKYYQEKGFTVIIFGDKDHKEVKGINGWCGNQALIVKDFKQARQSAKKIKADQKAVLLSQTTQNSVLFKEIATELKKQLKHILVMDTICRSTFNRQNEVKRLANNKDAIIVIGGKESGNTKRLWEVAKQINKNSFWISELDAATRTLLKKKLRPIKTLGVISGASAPKWEIQEIIAFLKGL